MKLTKKEVIKKLTEYKASSIVRWEGFVRGETSVIDCGYCEFATYLEVTLGKSLKCTSVCPVSKSLNNCSRGGLYTKWCRLTTGTTKEVAIAKEILALVRAVNVRKHVDKIWKELQ